MAVVETVGRDLPEDIYRTGTGKYAWKFRYNNKFYSGTEADLQSAIDALNRKKQEVSNGYVATDKIRPVPNEAYYLETIVQKLDEVIKAQADIIAAISKFPSMPSTETFSTVENTSKTLAKRESVHTTKYLIAYDKAKNFILHFLSQGEQRLATMDETAYESKDFSYNVYLRAKSDLYKSGEVVQADNTDPITHHRRFFVRLKGSEPSLSQITKAPYKSPLESIVDTISLCPTNFDEYDSKARNLAWKIQDISPKGQYANIASIYKQIFDMMTNQYGICWAQLNQECKESEHLDRVPSRLQVCYSNFLTRNIFMTELEDLCFNLYAQKTMENNVSAA